MDNKKVLFVVTAADQWRLKDGTMHPTGFWAEELAVPHEMFTHAGWDITIATPGGVRPTLDELSLGISGGAPSTRTHVKQYLHSIEEQLAHPAVLENIDHNDFDVVFYPGGHGPMEDLAHNHSSGQLLAERVAAGRPVALLCHAPAAILAADTDTGANAFAGYTMTGLSNREELLNPFAWKAEWLLENAMKDAGVNYRKGLPLRPFIVRDGAVYSGQNPQSSAALAHRIIADLG
ncbi:transcriptional regulator [Corynebacterium aquilae DSM 44791]|uniref:Transcriptional regulator n=1 Tax=Corynebacterium aquilae DSM 44791 TaxID=1431546 RepID=A0A1L7CIR9_9CORY|nr:transcriptional regulator [Corynebacterium aquilae DSM 44791]